MRVNHVKGTVCAFVADVGGLATTTLNDHRLLWQCMPSQWSGFLYIVGRFGTRIEVCCGGAGAVRHILDGGRW